MSKKGYKQTEEHKGKTCVFLRRGFGENSPNWQGGIGTQRSYDKRLRKSVLEALGGKCVKCGFDDYRALQIDHVNGGGSKERKDRSFTGTFHKHVLKSFLAKENKYQLLCANCNWIKRFENNESIGKFN